MHYYTVCINTFALGDVYLLQVLLSEAVLYNVTAQCLLLANWRDLFLLTNVDFPSGRMSSTIFMV